MYDYKNIVIRPNTTDENVIKEIFIKKAYLKKKINFDISPDDVWLDGGAHIGIFSCFVASKGAKKVYSYEPEDQNWILLNKNTMDCSDKTGCKFILEKKAINQNGGTGTFTIAPNTWRHSLHTHYKKKLPTTEIDCIAIDEILKNQPDINCIKLDIEGSELEILQNDHDFSKIDKLVFEYSFTKDRKMDTFFKCVDKLEKYFYVDIQKSYYNQNYQGQKGYWGGFIDSIIFCMKK